MNAQKKLIVKLPSDPKPYKVIKVQRPEVTAEYKGEVLSRHKTPLNFPNFDHDASGSLTSHQVLKRQLFSSTG